MKKILALTLIVFFCSFVAAENKEMESKRAILSALPNLEGWCTTEKAMNFFDLVLEVKPKTCVEIGVFGGSSVFPVAVALKHLGEGVVYAIDPWDKLECIKYFDPLQDAANYDWWSQLDLNYVYKSYMRMVNKYSLGRQCITLRMTSELAAANPAIDEIDILHIDGNHSEEASLTDVSLYLPKVRSGGYIWYNDVLWQERQEALEVLLQACEVVKLIDSGNCILLKKR